MVFTNTHILAGLAGITTHASVFSVGEWDVVSPGVFISHVVVFLGAVLASRTPLLQSSLTEVMRCIGYYIGGLYLSMLVYRMCFHRLCNYPGPFLAKLTDFYITARVSKKMHLFEEIQNLHLQYGDYVRVGPSELSITDPEAVEAIYGAKSSTSKGPWYTLLESRTSLFTTRDKQEHARRRKIWEQGFTTKALLGYDLRITKAINDLLQVIERDHQQPINITKWLNFFVFDVMEDLAFNKNSNMLHNGEEAYILKTIREDMFNITFFSRLPWLLSLWKQTPFLNRNYLKFRDWIQAQIDERIKNPPNWPDIFSFILADFNRGKRTQLDCWNLHGDAQLIVAAGSHSTAATLTHIFFHLAYDADLVEALQREFDVLPNLAHDNLVTVSLLDGVINETMRLHPPVPSGMQRVTPPGGLQIGERTIPEHTIVQVPSYTTFRDPRSFELPNDFIPERWTTRPELIKNKSAFIPFNIGPHACVGKNLALMEIRRVLAELLSRYDVRIAPGQSKQAFLDGQQDTFTLIPGPLLLNFTPRD